MHTCDYPVRQLQGPSWGAGRCLRRQEGGPPTCVGMEIPHPPASGEGAEAPEAPESETPATQQEVGEKVDTEVEMEVEPTPEGTEE